MLLMIDSGAARSVCPESYAKHVISSKCNDGISLVGANGGVTPSAVPRAFVWRDQASGAAARRSRRCCSG